MKNKLKLMILGILATIPMLGFADTNMGVVYLISPAVHDAVAKDVSVDYDVVSDESDNSGAVLQSLTNQHFATSGPMQGIMAIGTANNTHIRVKNLISHNKNDGSTITYSIPSACSVFVWVKDNRDQADYNALEFKTINNYMTCTRSAIAVDNNK